MKKGIIKGVQKIGDNKSYIPDETLVNFIQDWLHIHKKREQLTKEGKELPSEDKKKLRELDRMKVHYLDNTIFPALANKEKLCTNFTYRDLPARAWRAWRPAPTAVFRRRSEHLVGRG